MLMLHSCFSSDCMSRCYSVHLGKRIQKKSCWARCPVISKSHSHACLSLARRSFVEFHVMCARNLIQQSGFQSWCDPVLRGVPVIPIDPNLSKRVLQSKTAQLHNVVTSCRHEFICGFYKSGLCT